jgi:cobalt-zinc-cadmium efflux system outer membrane protein
LAVLLAWAVVPHRADAQGPTIDSGEIRSPGTSEPLMGPAPGSGGGPAEGAPTDAPILSGRPGTAGPRVPASLSAPGGTGEVIEESGIAAPRPSPLTEQPLYGSLALPTELTIEGPPNGLTLDQAIERLVTCSLNLRSKFMEIPQAQADILGAGLRANPIFYADGQLVPYGDFTKQHPGGQTQYDVNVSYPLDVTHKRQARIVVASRAKKVLEAQYQDAVRMEIDNLYTAYVDVLAARQTAIYARKSYDTLGDTLQKTEIKYRLAEVSRPEVDRARVLHETSYIGLLDAEEMLKQKKRSLGVLLNLDPHLAVTIDLRGTIADRAPPPLPESELIQMALALRPDVVSYRLGIQRAEADVRLARANRLNDIYMLYQPYTYQNNVPLGLKSPISWALGVTVPLPVYNRNQGGILRAKLNVTQTQIELATLERQVVTEVQLAAKEYEITKRLVERIEKHLLPRAQQVRDDTEKLWRGGEAEVFAFIDAQKAYNDVVKQYLDTVVRHRRSMLALNTVLAQRVMP